MELSPLLALSALFFVGAFPSCRRDASTTSTEARSSPLPHRAYVWQRDWRAPIVESLHEGLDSLSGCVVLAAEVEWRDNRPHLVQPKVDWPALRAWGRPVSAALRISPYPGPFQEDDALVRQFCDIARGVVADAARHDIKLAEFQLDFDCAQKKLAGYRVWVRALREAVQPLPLVITTLPSWLGEPEFATLIREVPRYILQVHSISSPLGDEKTMICDPALATRWVAQASRLGRPFEIALPTYRSVVAYDAQGKLIGVSSDGARPSWPAGTTVREYETDATAMAALVAGWRRQAPTHCEGLLWYRLPVGTDANNWRWPTFRAVLEGRAPRVSHAVLVHGTNPADLTLKNDGESNLPWLGKVVVRWEGETRATAEALPGWSVQVEAHTAIFSVASLSGVKLPPGAERAIGWLRLDPAIPFHAQTQTPP